MDSKTMDSSWEPWPWTAPRRATEWTGQLQILGRFGCCFNSLTNALYYYWKFLRQLTPSCLLGSLLKFKGPLLDFLKIDSCGTEEMRTTLWVSPRSPLKQRSGQNLVFWLWRECRVQFLCNDFQRKGLTSKRRFLPPLWSHPSCLPIAGTPFLESWRGWTRRDFKHPLSCPTKI